MIKVVDIFAGPGGLGEGFSSITDSRGNTTFDVVLSVEMERFAFETLKLRTLFRQFSGVVPKDYYRHLRGEITRSELFKAFPAETAKAESICWNTRLGPEYEPSENVRKRIDLAIGADESWVLIGGPPCQAYSLAGRSRNMGNPEYDPRKDVRQKLYVEYLQILADHRPAAFIMENVKGLLSATVGNTRMFHRILDDLKNPGNALAREGRSSRCRGRRGYRIYSLVQNQKFENDNIEGSVIQAEKYGVPQSRHRVILFGVRDDIRAVVPRTLKMQSMVSVNAVIGAMPALRSGLSKQRDSGSNWQACLRAQSNSRWAKRGAIKADSKELSELICKTLRNIEKPNADRGGEFVDGEASPQYQPSWFIDKNLQGVCNHSTRGHMESDLCRYLYAACFANIYGKSPSLQNFPTDLLPHHGSVGVALEDGGNFSDRFRVQIANRPSTTVVSHISKDGHYYIHPDPFQCRSLTVREAARLQTFPDNYFFCGPRTAQYTQVGNAVPPFLAKQIGEIILDLLRQAGIND